MTEIYCSEGVRLPDPPTCPVCGVLLDGTAALSSRDTKGRPIVPTTGDITVCMYCASMLVFDTPSRLRLPTTAELQTVHPQVREFLSHLVVAAQELSGQSKSKPS